MAINPKDKLREYTNMNKIPAYKIEPPKKLGSINSVIPNGKYKNQKLKNAYEKDIVYFEQIFFKNPLYDIEDWIKQELREQFQPQKNENQKSTPAFTFYFKELDYTELWIKFHTKTTFACIEIINRETKERVFRKNFNTTNNELRCLPKLIAGRYFLSVTSGTYKFEPKPLRIEAPKQEYSILRSLQKRKWNNRKEIKDYLKSRKYSVRQITRIISQYYSIASTTSE